MSSTGRRNRGLGRRAHVGGSRDASSYSHTGTACWQSISLNQKIGGLDGLVYLTWSFSKVRFLSRRTSCGNSMCFITRCSNPDRDRRARHNPDQRPVEHELAKLVVFETGGVALARDAARNYASFGVVVIRCERTIDWLIATFCLRDVA